MTTQSLLDRAAGGGRITAAEALELYVDAPFHALGGAADAARRERFASAADLATYLIDRNINYTNVCVTACKFCAFYRAPKHADGWVRDLDEILLRCAEAVDLGATQIMLQGATTPTSGSSGTSAHSPPSRRRTRRWRCTRSGLPRSSTSVVSPGCRTTR